MNVYCENCKEELEIMQDLGSELHVSPCGCIAAAQARAKTAEENWHKNEARMAKLLESIKAAQVELCATQRNWDEECLFECNDILTAALKGAA